MDEDSLLALMMWIPEDSRFYQVLLALEKYYQKKNMTAETVKYYSHILEDFGDFAPTYFVNSWSRFIDWK